MHLNYVGDCSVVMGIGVEVGKVGGALRRGVRRDGGTTDSCQPPARINL